MDKRILINYLDSLGDKGIPGCDCIIYKDHKEVFRHVTGFADHKNTKPLKEDNTYWLYSATKVITCTAFMQLVEGRKINLDDPVSIYLPEYKDMSVKEMADGKVNIKRAEKTMTLRHLMSMQSGLNYDLDAPSIRNILKEKKGQATTREVIGALAKEALEFEPGTRYLYSLSHDVLGAIIEVVTGKRLGQYFKENIFEPLKMTNTGFEWTDIRKSKMSQLFTYREEDFSSKNTALRNRYILSDNYESGGAGLISTVNDYILILDALCNGGVTNDGHTLLTMGSINEMRKDQLHDVSRRDFNLHGKVGYSYGLGVRTLIEKENSGARSPLGEFGWDGAAGAYGLIDIDNSLAIFYIQHVLNCGYAYSTIHPKIRDLTYEMMGL